MHAITVSVVTETSFGDRVVVVGSNDKLGLWQPFNGIDIFTDEQLYPQWRGDIQLSEADYSAFKGGSVEFKFVVVRTDGSLLWEPGFNRRAAVGAVYGSKQDLLPNRFGDTVHTHVEVKLAGTCSLLLKRNFGCGTLTCNGGLNNREPVASSSTSAESVLAASHISMDTQRDDEGVRIREELQFHTGWHQITKQESVRCEDAFCHGSHLMGVADGVGGMAGFAGVDAAAFAAELMTIAKQADTEMGFSHSKGEPPSARAASIMAAAENGTSTYGASTAAILTLSGETLGVANLGDSGFTLLRAQPSGMHVVQRSVEQQHYFNCPYQLSRIPRTLAQKFVRAKLDSSEDCQRYDERVQPGDLILLYSDGLTDNLYMHEIVALVNEAVSVEGSSTPPDSIAQKLAVAAQERSRNRLAETPFSEEAFRQRMQKSPLGGKEDDVTVLAAWIAPLPARE